MRGGLIACFLASLAVVSCSTVEVAQRYAPDKPIQRTVARDRVAADDAATDPAPTPAKADPAPVQKPVQRPSRPADGLHLSKALGLVSVRPGPDAVVHTWCQQIVPHAHGVSMSDCLAGGLHESGHTSIEGRALVLHHQPPSDTPVRGRVLVIGATHGDEPSTIGMGFDWMARLRKQGTPYDWYWIPVLNPDGVTSSPETRVNADGVDLNRNLPTEHWKTRSAAYWKRVGHEKRRFPGKVAGSEPENQWLIKVIAAVQPDIIITLHAPYGLLDYDGKFPPPKTVGHLHLHRLGIYPGSLGNFGFHGHGIPVMTLELENAQQPPPLAEADRMWGDINDWLSRYLSSVHQLRTANDGSSSAG